MRAFYSVTTATLAIAMAAPLSAQTFPGPVSDDEIANDPDQIVVVGSRSPVSISELPASVYVIDQELIAQQTQGGVAFREMLAQLVPSLDISTQGRTNFGQNLRGRDVQVLINGVSLNGSRDISRQFDAIDPFNIERIEVLSGASSVYGGGATGGIINIITKKGAPGLGVSAEAGVRSGFEAGVIAISVPQHPSAGVARRFMDGSVLPIRIMVPPMMETEIAFFRTSPKRICRATGHMMSPAI